MDGRLGIEESFVAGIFGATVMVSGPWHQLFVAFLSGGSGSCGSSPDPPAAGGTWSPRGDSMDAIRQAGPLSVRNAERSSAANNSGSSHAAK